MSDPIADIIDECAENLEPPNEDSFVPFEKRDQIIAYTAKQIRQQIGRENNGKIQHILFKWWRSDYPEGLSIDTLERELIREVCQMEES